MICLKRIEILILLAIFVAFPCQGQKSIGVVEQESNTGNVDDIPLNKWPDNKFIFLEKPKSEQKNGYYGYFLRPKAYLELFPIAQKSDMTNSDGSLKYDKFVGKIMIAQGIEDKGDKKYEVFILDGSSVKIYSQIYTGVFHDIAYFDDLGKAKKRWLGKKVYSSTHQIMTYDSEAEKYGRVKVGISEPLNVIDIWWGVEYHYGYYPIWIIVETSKKEKGFIRISYSWTNQSPENWTSERPWEGKLYEDDLRERLKYSDEIWNLIDNQKVKIGMTKEQVILSWGIPDKINKDISETMVTEQWVYDSGYLYFRGGKLVTIQKI